MKVIQALLICVALLFVGGISADSQSEDYSNTLSAQDTSNTSPFNYFDNENLFLMDDSNSIKVAFNKCGFKPFPPFGCKVSHCACDSSGNNCSWQFVCK